MQGSQAAVLCGTPKEHEPWDPAVCCTSVTAQRAAVRAAARLQRRLARAHAGGPGGVEKSVPPGPRGDTRLHPHSQPSPHRLLHEWRGQERG